MMTLTNPESLELTLTIIVQDLAYSFHERLYSKK